MSRILVFFPFFVMGFYIKKNIDLETYKEKINKTWKIITSVILLLGLTFIIINIYRTYGDFAINCLYGSYSYKSLEYGISLRLKQYVIAMFILISLIWFIPNKKYLLSYIGRYTISIYLLHGFIIKILGKEGIINYNKPSYLLLIEYFVITTILIFILPSILIIKRKLKKYITAFRENKQT